MSALHKTRTVLLTLMWLLTLVLVVVWDQNTLSIVASGLGVAATLLLLFNLRWWRGVSVAGSALFLLNWAMAFAVKGRGASPLETYGSVLREAAHSGNALHAAVVLGYEAALPSLHVLAAVLLVVSLFRRRAAG